MGCRSGNSRNGKSRKTLKIEQGQVEVAGPRVRQGTFEPQLIRKHQTRWDGLDQKTISLYARGLTVRDFQAQLQEIYGEVTDEVKTWQHRPLENMYPVV